MTRGPKTALACPKGVPGEAGHDAAPDVGGRLSCRASFPARRVALWASESARDTSTGQAAAMLKRQLVLDQANSSALLVRQRQAGHGNEL